jgi:hypothetical protein
MYCRQSHSAIFRNSFQKEEYVRLGIDHWNVSANRSHSDEKKNYEESSEDDFALAVFSDQVLDDVHDGSPFLKNE